MQRYVEVQRGLQRYVEVHERYVEGGGRCEEVHGGVCRCVIGGMEGAWRCTKVHGDVQSCTEIGRGVQRCTEVCVSVWRDVWRSERCMELHMQVHEGGKWRYMEGWTKVFKGLYEGVQRYAGVSGGVNWLPLPTIDLMGDNREIEAYFEVLYPFLVVDSLRTLKVHHYLSLVTIGCPSTHPAVYFCIPPCTSCVSPYTSLHTSS